MDVTGKSQSQLDNRGSSSVQDAEGRDEKNAIEIAQIEETPDTLYKRFVIFTSQIIDSYIFIGFMVVLTVWSIFAEDIRIIVTSNNYKDVTFVNNIEDSFKYSMIAVMVIFGLEIILTSLCNPDYFKWPEWKSPYTETRYEKYIRRLSIGSFYFWIDIIATVSFIFNITHIINYKDPIMIKGPRYYEEERIDLIKTNLLIRAYELTRMVRLVKYVSYVTKPNSNIIRKGDDYEVTRSESRVGSKMSDLTNQRLIVLTICMIMMIPSLVYPTVDTTYATMITWITQLYYLKSLPNATAYTNSYQRAIDKIKTQNAKTTFFITYYNGTDKSIILDKETNCITKCDIKYITYKTFLYDFSTSQQIQFPYIQTNITFDNQNYRIQYAQYTLYRSIAIVVLLLLSTYLVSNDVNKLVIIPLERMVELVRQISADPLGVEYKMLGAADGFREGLETTVLLSTITKIGGLMRVGFGEAGADIIAKNLKESTGGRLNLLGTGNMIRSIFGFCDVRNFTDTTECLQEEVMLFVNRIAHILHGIVVQCSGCANKNIGDAFLLTWKIDDKVPSDSLQISELADKALLAFLKTLIELIRNEDFICNFSTAATSRLYKRFPSYNVRIGCGLHYGWAIEGAIGTNRKIDASYLSPNVNFTEYLESSTKTYDVPLLMSEPFYNMLSPAAKKYCRQVDRIRRNEGEEPVGLYTYDADLSINFADPLRKRHFAFPRRGSKGMPRLSLHGMGGTTNSSSKLLRDHSITDDHTTQSNPMQSAIMSGKNNSLVKDAPVINLPPYTQEIWETDEELIELRHRTMSAEFRRKWHEGMEHFLEKRWFQATQCFSRTLELSSGNDGPSKFLLKVMEETNYDAPADWPGYRIEGGH